MKKVISAVTSLVTFLLGHAQEKNQDDLLSLRTLNAKFIHNFVTNDTVSHSKIIHPLFVCITSEGRLVKRKEYLNYWLHGFDGYVYWDYRDEQITIFGNTALVRSQNKYVIEKDGKEISGMSIYTDTYIKEHGEWKCIQAQLGNVTPANYAGDETIIRKYDFRKR